MLSGGGFGHVLQVPLQRLPDKRWDGVRDVFNNWLAILRELRAGKCAAAAVCGARICNKRVCTRAGRKPLSGLCGYSREL